MTRAKKSSSQDKSIEAPPKFHGPTRFFKYPGTQDKKRRAARPKGPTARLRSRGPAARRPLRAAGEFDQWLHVWPQTDATSRTQVESHFVLQQYESASQICWTHGSHDVGSFVPVEHVE